MRARSFWVLTVLGGLAACGPMGAPDDGGARGDGAATGPDAPSGADAAREDATGSMRDDAVNLPADSAVDASSDAGGSPGPEGGTGTAGRIVTTTPAPGDPAMRSQSDVCAVWNDAATRAATAGRFVPGAMRCDPGMLPQNARDAAVLMTNVYRWLAGLANVTESMEFSSAAQACAELMQANGSLSHMPPMTWNCYTALGAMGAARSNIAAGTSTPVAAVSGWVDDQRDSTMTLGHRRWMLYPRLATVGYGQAQSMACQYVIGPFNSAAKSWVAWPNEGVTPLEASTPLWSFSSASLGVTAMTRAAVTANGTAVSVTSALRANGYGDPTISWMMPALVAGTTYRVTISGLRDGAAVSYDVRPVRCGG